jgi:hypothetical protein
LLVFGTKVVDVTPTNVKCITILAFDAMFIGDFNYPFMIDSRKIICRKNMNSVEYTLFSW